MTQTKILLAGLVAAVALVPMGHGARAASPMPSWSDGEILVAGETEMGGANTDENAQDSAKMGKDEGTHSGPNQGATPESDTKKVDQPERRDPTTGGDSDDAKE